MNQSHSINLNKEISLYFGRFHCKLHERFSKLHFNVFFSLRKDYFATWQNICCLKHAMDKDEIGNLK